MTEAVVFLYGLIIGSFLNVCIARLPLDQSLARPRSRCPRCGAAIRWFDNIPVLRFLLLRGRCRSCGLPISWRYPLVELANGLLYLLCLRLFGLTGEGVLAMLFCSALLVVTFIDFDHQIIPDVITLPGIVIGLAAAPFFLTPLDDALPFGIAGLLPLTHPYVNALLNSALGVLAGGGPLLLIGWAWEKFRGIEAMGGGDVKLMGMVGSLVGWKGALMTIMLGAVAGALIGVGLIVFKKQDAGKAIPFGPYLAVGALVTLFAGSEIRDWYFGMLIR